MTARQRYGLGLTGAIAVMCWLGLGERPLPGADPAPKAAAAGPVARRPPGTDSCSATACHGRVVDVDGKLALPVAGSEYSIWMHRDPHSEAFAVLSSERSKSIASRLSLNDAQRESRCLACHTTPGGDPQEGFATGVRRYGVDCDSCHGSATGEWFDAHITSGWKQKTAAQKEAAGLKDLGDPARRADVCAGCHMGAPAGEGLPARSVDHDLIAAGHPRLTFEYSAYLAGMPRHWVDRPRAGLASSPAREWVVGQVATARAALRLLETRAESRAGGQQTASVWPEFADQDCTSCHRELGYKDRGARFRRAQDEPGSPRLGPWPYAVPVSLADMIKSPESTAFKDEWDLLRAAMSSVLPDPKTVVNHANLAATRLNNWSRSLPANWSPGIAEARKLVAPFEGTSTFPDMDEAAQVFLALEGLERSLNAPQSTGPDAGLRKTFEELRRKLPLPVLESAHDASRAVEDAAKPTP